jgi:hypothetical protein
LLNTLLDSNFAAAFTGPKILNPLFMNSSTIPSANGLSGPTMVSQLFPAANFIILSKFE